ncbi:DUF6541 family protein [Cellulosimicrobium sp. KWT-B]|uniref:DUF6541 family protein n=1 Tax=Cellulosimicrobium sp. KWT-B TaxID=1981152 RepID=UPI000A31F075|nr:DUF6541 family protein [Cellulosimicrobium sp. KWT-B]
MSWWQAADELALALAWLVVPGVLLGWAIGLRGSWRVLAAPPLSVALLAAWPIALGAVGVSWDRLSAAVSVAITVAAAGVLLRPVRQRTAVGAVGVRKSDVWAVVGVGIAAVSAVVALRRGIGEPDLPPQTWDGVFHLNAIRHILDSGDASSLDLGVVANTVEGRGFYPGAWHSVVSLSTTDSVVVASNATTLVLVGLVWPLAVVALARVVTPSWPLVSLASPVAAAAFVAFPERMVTWGTLWPNALAYALVPTAVALTVVAAGRSRGAPQRTLVDRVPPAAAAAAALVAVALAQPSGLLAYAVLVTPALVAAAVVGFREQTARVRTIRMIALLLWLGGWAAVWWVLASNVGVYDRQRTSSVADAVVQAVGDGGLGSAGTGGSWSWALAVLVVAGAVTLFVLRQGRWAVVSYAVSLGLFALAADTTLGLRDLLRPWYADVVRLAGLVPIFGAVLAGTGVVGAAVLVGRAVASRWPEARARTTAVTTVGLVALLVVGTGWLRLDMRTDEVSGGYAGPVYGGATNILASADELAMLERLGDELPEDARILGDPFTGSALAYAVGGVDVVYTHVRGRWEPDAAYLGLHFDDIETDPAVCAALDRLGVRYLYVDPDLYSVGHPAHDLYEGLDAEPPAGDFALVDEGGSARVYEIQECG